MDSVPGACPRKGLSQRVCNGGPDRSYGDPGAHFSPPAELLPFLTHKESASSIIPVMSRADIMSTSAQG